ncbi:MAG TPA: M20/M25/M40 family metallo-hydrolase [Jatrophihabitans sp.]|uniref:M20/M25/M40 family metallo-hydrolase n=1 Tax=Jatrophihabitans sp. TaxID=1932789 RepID=UPI002EF68CF5
MSADREVVELLSELSAIDSANPSLLPGAAGEAKVAERVADWATGAGLGVEVFEAVPGRPSVVVRSRPAGSGAGRSLLLCGHSDTVPPGDMADPWGARIEGDRIYGRGVYDMKAGLVAALIACRDAAAAGAPGEVIVAAVADEEHSSFGVQEVLAAGVRADAAIVTEPTELAVATAHRGFVWTEIQVVGKAAHGSRPHLGVDAILKTGPILVALEELNQRLRGAAHPSLGPGTLHGSLITGGVGESTIPASCVLTIERRTLPGQTLADVEADIEDLLAGCRAADAGLEVSARTTLAREPFEVAAGSAIERAVVAATERVLGRPAPVGGVSYWADAAFLSAAGIPTVLFGPSGDGAHAQVEWTDLPSTVACARALTAAAIEFCR